MKAQKARLYKDVEFLTEIRPFRNYRNLESLKTAREYIEQEFENAGYKTEIQSWIADNKAYSNVIASYNSHKSKRLIIGAHYDVYGDQPGADDNASAVAGLLETARLIAKTKPDIDYRIDFVAYCLEEPPFFGTDQMGSYIHAKSLYDNKIDVLGMICYEMIGYFSDEPGSQSLPNQEIPGNYPDVGNFIIVVGIEQHSSFSNRIHKSMLQNENIDTQLINFPDYKGLAGLSDQRNYWKFGYDAVMINDTSFLRNPHYHLISDTIDTLNFDKMTEVVNAAYIAVSKL